MCGINGILSTEPIAKSEISQLLSRMNQLILHRGPDEGGTLEVTKEKFSLGMGMRRLSIIDLDSGKQPMSSEDGELHLVFNGEIYNYKILKADLQKQGVHFNTTSDTEVILKLYEKYGTSSFGMLDGMFAFSIYDARMNKVFIARDFFGEKPLYYYTDHNRVLWASELKSLLDTIDFRPQISPEGLNLFFRLTYIPAPYTIYQGIHKLRANHYLEVRCEDLQFSEKEISQASSEHSGRSISFEAAKKKTYDLVHQSVESRSVADVPLGTFLSGGVDSSVVSLALAHQKEEKIDTFSIGFEKKSFDETDKSRTVAKLIGSRHHEFIISVKDLEDQLDTILLNFDEPFADSSSLPTYLVAHHTRKHVKVALTGDGGDEVFGGYNKYYIGKLNNTYTSVIPQSMHKKIRKSSEYLLATKDDKRGKRFQLRKLLSAVNYQGDFYYNILSLAFQEDELRNILRSEHTQEGVFDYYKQQSGVTGNSLNDFRLIDKITSLEGDMLVKVDRTSMLTSLESRAPFLNKQLWDFTASLPEEYLMKGFNKKYLLKAAFEDEFPKGFLEKSKQGFGVPVGDWLREKLSSELLSYIDPDFLKMQHIFNIEEITSLVKMHLSGRQDNTFKVWTFYCFQKWYKTIYLNGGKN